MFYTDDVTTSGKMEETKWISRPVVIPTSSLPVSMEDGVFFSYDQLVSAASMPYGSDDAMKYINTTPTAPLVLRSPVQLVPGHQHQLFQVGMPDAAVDDDIREEESIDEILNEVGDDFDDNLARHIMSAAAEFILPPMSPDDIESLLSSSTDTTASNTPVPSSPVSSSPLPCSTLDLSSIRFVPVDSPVSQGVLVSSATPASIMSSILTSSSPIPLINAAAVSGSSFGPRILTSSPVSLAINIVPVSSPSPLSPSVLASSPSSSVSSPMPPTSVESSTTGTLSPVSSPAAMSLLSTSPAGSPAPGPIVVEKRQRKKEQNKTAALRYRHKKRSEQGSVLSEYEELEKRNIELKTKVSEMSKEVNYLKGLIAEICA